MDIVKFRIISHITKQRIFKFIDMQLLVFFLDKILKLSTYYTPFSHQPSQSYGDLKNSPFFGPPCMLVTITLLLEEVQNNVSMSDMLCDVYLESHTAYLHQIFCSRSLCYGLGLLW